jgi:hypothetical protein
MPVEAIMGAEFILPDQRNWGEYERFLAVKQIVPVLSGLTEVPALHPAMFPFQRDVCQWSLRLGRSAVFLGTGMGKTLNLNHASKRSDSLFTNL